jgi:hypothetical protein
MTPRTRAAPRPATPRARPAAPRADTAAPRADTAAPRADTAAPRADTPAPGADTAATRDRATPSDRAATPRARAATLLFGAAGAALLLVAAAAALLLSNESRPTPSAQPVAAASALRPVRVTSGDEIATGFPVGGNRVVTVAHILGGSPTVDGEPARVRRVDRRSDLALLTVPRLAMPRLTVPGGAAPVIADSASGGSPLRLLRVRDGRVSSLSVRVRRAIVAHVKTQDAARAVTRPALELAATVTPGDSGAPLVSPSGALAGVIFATSRARENTAYAVDASAVAKLLARD